MKKYISMGILFLLLVGGCLFFSIRQIHSSIGSAMAEDYANESEVKLAEAPSLTLSHREEKAIAASCSALAELYRDSYEQAEKVPSPYFGVEEISQETIDEIEALLIDAGYALIDSDSVYPSYLTHSEGITAFWDRVQQGTDAEVSFWGISGSGGLYYQGFQFTDGRGYSIAAGADWTEKGEMMLSHAEKREIFAWDMTYNGDLMYRDLPLNGHWDAAHLLRLHPTDHALYDLMRTYILPIGYQNANLFLLDWSSDNYGNLCFNDLLEGLYRIEYDDYLYAEDYPLCTASAYSYRAIPAELFESVVFPHFDISLQEFQERALYDAEKNIYPWQELSCDNILYFSSLIPEVTECIDMGGGIEKLSVRVMCPDEQTDKLFVHELRIRTLPDGGWQYLGNRITYKSGNTLPSPQARIPAQRFSIEG